MMYKVYNPDKDETTAIVYDSEDPPFVIGRAREEVNRKATGTKYGIVYDPERKWKFEDKPVNNSHTD